MTQATGNDDPRVASTINEALDLAATGRIPGAAQLLTPLVAEFPNAAGVHAYLAWFLLQLGRYDDAINHSSTAVTLAPKSENGSLIHFHALWKCGKQTEALDEMKRFLLIRPSDEYSKIIKEWEPNL